MKQGIKAYKVVTSQRNSCIFKGTKYNIKYKKGATVRAHEQTIGIMCFQSAWRAEFFMRKNPNNPNDTWRIIEVEGFNKRRFSLMAAVNSFYSRLVDVVDNFYRLKKQKVNMDLDSEELINNTILFDKVKVLT